MNEYLECAKNNCNYLDIFDLNGLSLLSFLPLFHQNLTSMVLDML